MIEMIEWDQDEGCEPGTSSNVTVEVIVEDPDTSVEDLSFTGSLCNQALDADVSQVVCPQVRPYPATVTVTDPEGNSDTATFTVGVCQDGSFP